MKQSPQRTLSAEAIFLCCKKPAKSITLKKDDINSIGQSAPHLIFNIGNNKSISIMDFIGALEKELGVSAIKKFEPIQKGDVEKTYANINSLKNIRIFSSMKYNLNIIVILNIKV